VYKRQIINCLKQRGLLQPYWLETGENGLIGESLKRRNFDVKLKLQDLIEGKSIEANIDRRTIFNDLKRSPEAVWSLLVYAGYLNAQILEYRTDGLIKCRLTIPNYEVSGDYSRFVDEWYKEAIGVDQYLAFLNSLITGDMEDFQKHLINYIDQSISYFDLGQKTPEKIYHVFVLGLVVGLRDDYLIKSNKEAGKGRFDLALIPKDKQHAGIIIEFKSVEHEPKLKQAAKNALQQIKKQNYIAELQAQDVNQIIGIGIAFSGKKVCVQAIIFPLKLLA